MIDWTENIIGKEINSIALVGGKMGFCMASFVLGTERDDKMLVQKAQGLLDEIAENIADIDSLNYGQGLAGIGYGIEWLAQNDFIQINSDEILSEIDDELYKSVVYSKSLNASLYEGILGKALFFLKRLKAGNPGTHRYKTICLNECLVLLSDELLDFLLNEEDGLALKDATKITEEGYLVLSQSLILFEKLFKININLDSAEKGLCGIIACMKKLFIVEELYSHENFIYLIHAYSNIAYKLNDNHLMNDAKKVFKIFFKKVEINHQDMINHYLITNLCTLFDIKVVLEEPVCPDGMESLLLSLADNYNWAEIWLLN